MDLYHQEAGAGPVVVLLHAGVCDSRMWDPQWVRFPRTHRTIRYDQRGYGRSPLPHGSWSHARDLIGLLAELGIQRAALVGVSQGGQIALELAVARPDLVDALVLVGAGLPGHGWSAPVQASLAEEDAAVGGGDLDAAVEPNLRLWVDGPQRSAGQPVGLDRHGGWVQAAGHLLLAQRQRRQKDPPHGMGGAGLAPNLQHVLTRWPSTWSASTSGSAQRHTTRRHLGIPSDTRLRSAPSPV